MRRKYFRKLLVLPPSLQESFLDFGVQSSTVTSSITLVVVNSNPIELEIRSWLVPGDSLSLDLLKADQGNQSVARGCVQELQNASASHQRTVILASGYYAAFRVTLNATGLKGPYERAVHITTDYEILTIPVKALIAVGTLSSCPEHLTLPPSFPDQRFSHRRLRHAHTLEPRRSTKVANIYFDAGVHCGNDCYVGLPFVHVGESRPGGPVLQEDIWDEDVDLLQMLLGRWNDLVEHSGHEVKAVFEVNSDLQQNVRSEVTARLTWPSLLNSSQRLMFPLTNANSSSDKEVVLENPADVPVFVQLVPLTLFPSPSVLSGKLADRLPWANLSNINLDTKTLEFHVHGHPGPSKPSVYKLLLQPGERKSFNVRFTPSSNHSVWSLLIVRNNLTVMDVVLLEGRGVLEHLKVGGNTPGQEGYLRFKVTEALLKHCTDQTSVRPPALSLRRTFKVENTGVLPVHVTSAQIDGHPCAGYGFAVLDCQDFVVPPNSSRDLVIMFTPDFSMSRVIRELSLVTRGGSEFTFVLNASLPHHMLWACGETLPRPAGEWDFCLLVSLIMSSLLLLVGVTAYLEAHIRWETFRMHLLLDECSPQETGPLDLGEAHSHTPGFYGSEGGASRVGGRHGNGRVFLNVGGPDKKSRTGSLCGVALGLNGSTSGSAQQANRKPRSGRQQPIAGPGPELKDASSTTTDTSNMDTSTSDLEASIREEPVRKKERTVSFENREEKTSDLPFGTTKPDNQSDTGTPRRDSQSGTGTIRRDSQSGTGINRRDSQSNTGTTRRDIQSGTGTNRRDSQSGIGTTRRDSQSDTGTTRRDSQSGTGTIRRDSQSETGTTRRDNQSGKETTGIENQSDTGTTRRDSQSDTGTIRRDSQSDRGTTRRASQSDTGTTRRDSIPKANASLTNRHLDYSSPVPDLDYSSPVPDLDYQSNLLPELDHRPDSEEEKELDPPEWDLPPSINSSQVASLQQISMQTMNADLFLQRSALRLRPPPPGLPALLPVDGYRHALDATSGGTRRSPGARCSARRIPGQIQGHDPGYAAGYDRSPGAPGMRRPENPTHILTHTTSLDIFTGIHSAKKPELQQSWSEPPATPSSIWDGPPSDPLTSWANGCVSPTIPTTSIFTTSGISWSAAGPFSSSIWSTSRDPSLRHGFPTPSDDMPAVPEAPPSPGELSPTYNPWSMWRPMQSRRSSDPWPRPSYDRI
ncbi:hypothetical protein NHX12_033691 [Muraenolepis orangiensis]|uniref:Transmembrane protein 131 n=1 Tax=Muraenolepis orangiensis TaxID=630683 RepID=A0A9Q0E6G5_9TELE|nr:hypothetical protein NHX12_033691 [Muraenolepis orangiensis]